MKVRKRIIFEDLLRLQNEFKASLDNLGTLSKDKAKNMAMGMTQL